ncbi:MAG: ribonuclease HII, partial [Patescibacteria group bacterium]
MRRRAKYLVGIDEVGRGPLAGPVAVGVVRVAWDFEWSSLPGVTDSKLLKPEQRAEIAAAAAVLRHRRQLDYAVAQVGP